jgi:hypothetical protein
MHVAALRVVTGASRFTPSRGMVLKCAPGGMETYTVFETAEEMPTGGVGHLKRQGQTRKARSEAQRSEDLQQMARPQPCIARLGARPHNYKL